MNILGISGEAGSGKDTFASIYKQLSNNVATVSLGDLVREELTKVGATPDRKLQAIVANYRRDTAGSAYWIDRALSLARPDVETVILTGIYAPDEARHIQRLGGLLIWVEASEACRVTRITNRQDGSRDSLLLRDPAAFSQQLEIEKGGQSTSGTAVSLLEVKALADHTIHNDGDLRELENTVKQLIGVVLREAARRKGNLGLLAVPEVIKYEADVPWSDTLNGLGRLEKTYFFEQFLGSSDAFVPDDVNEVTAEMSLRDAVRVFYKPNLRSITGNQTAKRIAAIFEEEMPDAALKKLRALKPSNYEEEYFTGLTDAEFYDLHLKAYIKWATSKDEIMASLPQRLEDIRGIDRLQFGGKKDRGINRVRQDGVLFSVAKEHIDQLISLANNPILAVRPILEIIKNERIFQVSGFVDSKASVVAHDIVDHMWTFDLLDRIGLLKKYQVMFDAIGNPDKVDIYKREGEIVASISYGVRAFEGVAPGFRPLIGSKDIVRMVRELRGRLSETHTEALRIVNNIESDGTEWRSLSYTYSNYITELDEQRRVFGSIKYRDPKTHQIKGELDPFSPDYLCFFIEVHHALLDSANKHRNALFYTHFIIEEYLRSFSINGPATRPISITPDLLDGRSLRYSTSVPKEVSEWMFRNYGFTANRNLV